MNLKQIKISKIPVYIKMILSHEKPLKSFIANFLVLTKLSKFIIIKTSSFKLRFFPSSLTMSYFISSNARKGDEDVISRYLNHGENYVDIGANIGALALHAASLAGPKGIIFAIEPHPEIYSYLVNNIKLNKFTNIISLNYAVGEVEGTFGISNRGSDDQNFISNDLSSIKVIGSTIDKLVHIDNIKFLKIDVEGYELMALKGAKNTLQKTEIVFIEIGDENSLKFGYTSKEVLELLSFSGFYCYKLNSFYKPVSLIGPDYINTKIENILCFREKINL